MSSRSRADDLALELQRFGGVIQRPGESAAITHLAAHGRRLLVVARRALEVAEIEQHVADVVQRDRRVGPVADLAANGEGLLIHLQR